MQNVIIRGNTIQQKQLLLHVKYCFLSSLPSAIYMLLRLSGCVHSFFFQRATQYSTSTVTVCTVYIAWLASADTPFSSDVTQLHPECLVYTFRCTHAPPSVNFRSYKSLIRRLCMGRALVSGVRLLCHHFCCFLWLLKIFW